MIQETTTAIVKVNPEKDLIILGMLAECQKLLDWAQKRIVASNDDVVLATEDLSGLSNLRKAIETRRKNYTVPLDDHKKTIMDFFRQLSEPLDRADRLIRDKILAYRQELERKRAEALAIEQAKLDLARREEALTGEHTLDLTPTERPPAAPAHVYTEAGTLGTVKTRRYRVIDFAKLPDEYKLENVLLLNKVTKAGIPAIAGVEFYIEESLRISPK